MTDDNPYQPPQADVVMKAFWGSVPESYRHGSITADQLAAAAWMAILGVLLAVLEIGAEIFAAVRPGEWVELIANVTSLCSTLAWIYVYIVLYRFLAARFELPGVKFYIWALIVFVLFGDALALIMDDAEGSWTVVIVFLGWSIGYGLVSLFLGKKLLSITTSYPYLKTFIWLTIVSGVLMVSVVLLMLAIPVLIAANVVLALLFFSARREMLAIQQP